MHVTKWGEYGILCSVFLARRFLQSDTSAKPAAVGALEVAQQQGIPPQYTQQILQRLRRGDIVKSVRGAKGGYVLSRQPSQITLLDIMKAAEGSTFDVMCETSPAYPSEGKPSECAGGEAIGGCNLRDVWLEVRAAIDGVLSRRTLESLVVSTSGTVPKDGIGILVQISPQFAKPADETSISRQFDS